MEVSAARLQAAAAEASSQRILFFSRGRQQICRASRQIAEGESLIKPLQYELWSLSQADGAIYSLL